MIEILWRYGYRAAIAVLGILLLHHHWLILTAPVPLDLYEGTAPLITGIIAAGHNPYTAAFQPAAAYVYPPLYNILVAPFALAFGNTLQLHRLVSAVFILVSCGFCAGATRKHSGSLTQAAAAAVLLYVALLFYGTPVASTNALGVAVFLAGLIIPWYRQFSNGSLLFALLCGVLAFYSKQYFVLGMATLCLYLFLYVSMRKALLLGISFSVVLLGSLVIVQHSSPYYLDNTFFTPRAAISGLQMLDILLLQLQVYAVTYAGLFLVLVSSGAYYIYTHGLTGTLASMRGMFSIREVDPGRGLLVQPMDFFWFCFFWSLVAIVVFLGRNPGNYMTYLFQLMSPFLLIGGFKVVARIPRKLMIFCPALLACFYQAYSILPKDFSTDLESWDKVNKLIASNDEILATQMLLMSLIENGKEVHQDGHTFYFPLAVNKPDMFEKEQPQLRVASIWESYMTGLYQKVESRTFDLILISQWELRGIFERNPPPYEDVGGKEFLSRHYRVDERIPLSMTDRYGGGTYRVQVWRPREDVSP